MPLFWLATRPSCEPFVVEKVSATSSDFVKFWLFLFFSFLARLCSPLHVDSSFDVGKILQRSIQDLFKPERVHVFEPFLLKYDRFLAVFCSACSYSFVKTYKLALCIVLRIVSHQFLPPSCLLSSGQQFDVLSRSMCLGGKTSACARSWLTLTTSLCLNAWEKDAVLKWWVMEQCDPWASAVKAGALILSKGKKSYLSSLAPWLFDDIGSSTECSAVITDIELGFQIILGIEFDCVDGWLWVGNLSPPLL